MATRKSSNHFLVQGSILAAASLIVRIIGLIYRIPMQRIIGDEGMGYYNYAFEIYNIALILSSYSLPLAVSKLVASRGINREHKNAYRIFLCALGFATLVGLTAASIIFFGAEFFSTVINNDPNAALPLRILAPTIFVFSVMGVFRGFYQGKNTMIPTAVSQVLEQVINAIVSVMAAYLLVRSYSANINIAAYGAAGGTMGTLIGAMAALLFLMFVFVLYKPYLNKQMHNDTSRYLESYTDIIKLLILTISPIILSQTVYHISGLIDNSLFGHIMATKEVTHFDETVLTNILPDRLYSAENRRVLIGIYSNKYRLLTNVPVAIASAIGAAIITSISAAKVRGMDGVIRRKTHAAIKFNMLIAIPSAVGMGVLASPILQLLFKDANQLSANFIRLGSIAIIFFSLSTVSTAILQGVNKLKIPVINSAISLGIHILLVFILLKFTPLSTYALVIGNVTFALVVTILNWISIEKYLNYRQEIIKTFLIPFVSAGLMGIAVYFTYEGLIRWTGNNTLSTLLCIGAAIIIYFALVIFMKGIEEDELTNLPRGEKIIHLLKRLHLL
ncbi:polysaccharide biosynthesis protein [Mobilitalea sibirica]|uniref:Polysaccharide biosynthesis protein n=1 Tax=Mobilitalea sibirica TaxID=1462919 RepID=A0A8J7H422_9FIRM|nr:polysaccharide biosynthesis protein [Mobilitalea sibirica]MBH1941459.1 polysaccharide biosynthesis protein [Mobilitalea sibirica]